MRTRAILIGIEHYRENSEVGSSLPGTLANIDAFRTWLSERNPNDLQIIEERGNDKLGPSSSDVIGAFQRAADRWREGYDELFVYIAGHGFSYKPLPYLDYVDVLVCSDFVNSKASGRACIMIPEMQTQLRGLGPGVQHWFVEVCRVVHDGINVATSGLFVEPCTLGPATINTLFATSPGMLQDVGDTFNRALIDGLRGEGRAKIHEQGKWVVNFQRLAAFVSTCMRESLAREASERPEDSGRVLVVLQKVDPRKCHIEVVGANADASFRVDVWNGRNRLMLDNDGRFKGNQHDIALQPGDYEIEVNGDTGALERLAPPTELVDLYHDRDMRFSAETTPSSRPKSRDANVMLRGLGAARVRLMGGGGHDEWVHHDASVAVPPGDYAAELLDATGVVATRRFKLASGHLMSVDFRKDGITPAHEAIAHRTGNTPDEGIVLSESVGPLDSRDLNVWLGMIGAGRVMDFGFFDELPSLQNLPRGASGLIVLSTLEGDGAPREALFTSFRAQEHLPLHVHPSLSASIAHGMVKAPSAGVLVFDDRWALATTLLPDRVTVVTLATGPDGVVAIRQLALPPASVLNTLPPKERFMKAPMRHVKFGLEAQGRFLSRRPVLLDHGAPSDKEHWGWLARGEFIDPVTSLLVALEMLRRGERNHAKDITIALRERFGSLPDIAALELTLGLPVVWPDGLPLLQDQLLVLRAADRREKHNWLQGALPPLLKDPQLEWTLDMTSPWTSWVRRMQK